jgi:hypothetical protein
VVKSIAAACEHASGRSYRFQALLDGIMVHHGVVAGGKVAAEASREGRPWRRAVVADLSRLRGPTGGVRTAWEQRHPGLRRRAAA